MDVREVGENGQDPLAEDDERVADEREDDELADADDDDNDDDDDDDDDDDPVVPQAWLSKPFRLFVMGSVVVLMALIGFVGGKIVGVGNNVVRSDIPAPEATTDPFVEGSGSIAENNEENILATTAPGMVHILQDGKSVGTGLVLTESGRVLTTWQPPKGATNLVVQYVRSGAHFTATVTGTDKAAGLTLLQMAGSPGWPFVTIQAGNIDRLASNLQASSFNSYHVPGQIIDTAVGTSGTSNEIQLDTGTLTSMDTTVDVSGGGTLSGLLASKVQSDVPSAIGGPLVDLNGNVIGITIGGSGSGSNITAYAIPINTALADAQQIVNNNP